MDATPEEVGAQAGIPERIVKHDRASRIYHWLSALTIFVLLVTAFLPILGIQFAWVTIHWIAGIVLTVLIIYHVIRTLFFQRPRLIWPDLRDFSDAWRSIRRNLLLRTKTPGRPGKYPLENKLYHHTTATSAVIVTLTGLIMMAKVDTPWWDRNPYLLPDHVWGVIYVLHGLASVAFVALIMVHIYFALRPEKLWITATMFRGWIRRDKYLEHHDPERWPLGGRPRRRSKRGGATVDTGAAEEGAGTRP